MSADGPLYIKYEVNRTDKAEEDPESKHFGGCFCFVIDVDHDPYAIPAITAYADACEITHPQLAHELRELIQNRGSHND